MKKQLLTLALSMTFMIPVIGVTADKVVASANAKGFKEKAKVTEKKARAIALKVQAGTIKKVKYEIEGNGEPAYDFTIVTKKGTKVDVEISAVTGKVLKDND